MRRISLVLLALAAFAPPLRAQGDGAALVVGAGYVVLGVAAIHRLTEGSNDVRLGSVVRGSVRTSAGLLPLAGSLAAMDRDSLTITADSVSRRFARDDVRSFSVYRGSEQKWAQGWLAGFVGGAAVGGAFGFAMGDDKDDTDWFRLTGPEKGLLLGAFGAVTGSLVGTLIGVAIPGERWDDIDRLPMTPSVSVAPLGGRAVAVGVHLRF